MACCISILVIVENVSSKMPGGGGSVGLLHRDAELQRAVMGQVSAFH